MKPLNRIALIPIAALLAVACKRDNVEKPIALKSTNTKATIVSYLDENDKPLLKDPFISFSETGEAVIVVEKYDEGSKTATARHFNNEEELYAYASFRSATSEHYNEVKNQIKAVREIRKAAIDNGDINKEEDNTFSEATMKVIEKYSSKVTARGVGVLLDKDNCSGSTWPLTGAPQPSLRGFKNRAESAAGIGLANRIWDKTWFRGASVYLLLGTGSCLPFHFSKGGFLNKAESAF